MWSSQASATEGHAARAVCSTASYLNSKAFPRLRSSLMCFVPPATPWRAPGVWKGSVFWKCRIRLRTSRHSNWMNARQLSRRKWRSCCWKDRRASNPCFYRWPRRVCAFHGRIAGDVTAKAPPDAYTLFTSSAGLAVNPMSYARRQRDPSRDFTTVALVAGIPN
jgi:Tripartite tricarboxylate transporter family receptor